jgi:hypothetical protein
MYPRRVCFKSDWRRFMLLWGLHVSLLEGFVCFLLIGITSRGLVIYHLFFIIIRRVSGTHHIVVPVQTYSYITWYSKKCEGSWCYVIMVPGPVRTKLELCGGAFDVIQIFCSPGIYRYCTVGVPRREERCRLGPVSERLS